MTPVLLMLALATQTGSGGHVKTIFAYDDYPKSALEKGEQGTVVPQIVTSPDGSVDSCTILISSGYKDLDEATCDIITKRARFTAAANDEHQPVYGVTRTVVNWNLGAPKTATLGPDVELAINHAPPEVRLPIELKVSYLVDRSGAVRECRRSAESGTAPQVLVDLACNAIQQSPSKIIRNRQGEPVDAMDEAKVRFSLNR